MTGNLDEVQIRTIKVRLTYLNELDERRATILASIESQGKLTDDLKEALVACATKNALEDLYLPYKPKRRTRAAIAREKGLEPWPCASWNSLKRDSPKKEAEGFISQELGVASVEKALAGAQDIVAEAIAERADIRAALREAFEKEGLSFQKLWRGKRKGSPSLSSTTTTAKESPRSLRIAILPFGGARKRASPHFQIEIDPEAALSSIRALCKIKRSSPFCRLL